MCKINQAKMHIIQKHEARHRHKNRVEMADEEEREALEQSGTSKNDQESKQKHPKQLGS